MDKAKLDGYKQRLLEEKKQVEERIQHLEENQLNLSMDDTTSELSSYDNHPGDLGSEMFERSKDLALRETAHINRAAIEDALTSIREGTYGSCTRCGKTIPEERLEVIPSSTLCVDCKEETENEVLGDKNVRPVEEDVLEPPFARSFLDHSDNNAYDGEDAWQEVASYGNASDIPNEESETRGSVYDDPGENVGYVEKVENIPTEKNLDGMYYQDFDGEDDETIHSRNKIGFDPH
jgi:YteA family regulatory protein